MRWIVAALIIAFTPLTVPGAELKLRDDASPSGSVVRLGDVADVSSADAAEAAELAAIPLLPAPAAGSRKFLAAAQIRDLLAASGANVSSLTFAGADAVAIGSTKSDVPNGPSSKTATEIATQPDPEAVVGHVQKAISRYLTEMTGHNLWAVKLDADAKVADLYWRCGPQLTVSGGRDPWTGRQNFLVGGPEGAGAERVYGKVERLEMVAFAVRAIPAGDLVRATDVALRPYAGVVPAQAVRSLDEVVGKEASQALRADAMLLTRQLRAPLMIRRGERVAIKVRAAGIVVRTYATAQQNGCLGDLIPVQTLEGKTQYMARVSGLRELEVFAGGASAEEVASAAR